MYRISSQHALKEDLKVFDTCKSVIDIKYRKILKLHLMLQRLNEVCFSKLGFEHKTFFRNQEHRHHQNIREFYRIYLHNMRM